jgi:hypothetical protein
MAQNSSKFYSGTEKSSNFIRCLICETRKPDNEIRTFDCDCKICVECLKEYLKVRYEKGQYELDIPCFNDACKFKSRKSGASPPLSQNLVRELLGKAVLDKMEMYLAYKFATAKCSNCSFRFELTTNGPKRNFVICDICFAATCVKCWKKYHPTKECSNHDQSLNIFVAKNKIRICPGCLEPATKDKGCDKVTCQCQTEFCFSCSAFRQPIIQHGNHYHRKDCGFYKPYHNENGNDVFDDKLNFRCLECLKTGKLCQRPNLTTKEFYIQKKVDQLIIDSLK